MNIKELLDNYATAEADEAKQSVIKSLELALNNQDNNSDLDDLKLQIEKLNAKNKELLSERQKAKLEADEANRKNMSVDELKADYERRLQESFDSKNNEWTSKYTELENSFNSLVSSNVNTTIDEISFKLASELSNNPKAILPHVRSRLGAEFEGGKVNHFILDSEGKRSASTIDELKQELKSTDYLSDFLKPDFTNTGETTQTKAEKVSFKGDSLAYLNSVIR